MKRWAVGDVTITRVEESVMDVPLDGIFRNADPEMLARIDWLKEPFVTPDGHLRISFHALVIEAPGRRIVVDTCVGNDKQRLARPFWHEAQFPFLERLAAAGIDRLSVDNVVCTHLHADHVGWNTMLVDGRWLPTFPNARYLIGRDEYKRFSHPIDAHSPVHAQELAEAILADSVTPIFELGLVDLVETDHRICPEVRLSPTPGHTPGHVSVLIESRGEKAMITGDSIHHPCQAAYPEWGAFADADPARAEATRRDLLRQAERGDVLVIGTHWVEPTAGRLAPWGEGYRVRFV